MAETKIVMGGDTMSQYVTFKETLNNNATTRLKCLNHTYPSRYVQCFIAYDDNKIRYYHARYAVYFSKNLVPYLKMVESSSFSFDKQAKKMTTNNITLANAPSEIIDTINELLGVEWFSTFTKGANYCNISKNNFYNKTILSLVWGKKITNPEDLIKIYTKRILQVKNITWTRIRKLLNKGYHPLIGDKRLLRAVDEWVNDPNLFIDKVVSLDRNEAEYLSDYLVYVKQIAALQIKSNVAKWSLKRMLNEHNKLSNVLMELEIDEKDDEPIFSDVYNTYLPKNIRCRFINTEKLCFIEGSSMHNCIYTNYWGAIGSLNYLAISIDDKVYGRATLGIRYNRVINRRNPKIKKRAFYIDQIRGIRNTKCNEDLENIMREWVDNNQDLLNKIFVEKLDITKKDDIFADVNEFDLEGNDEAIPF